MPLAPEPSVAKNVTKSIVDPWLRYLLEVSTKQEDYIILGVLISALTLFFLTDLIRPTCLGLKNSVNLIFRFRLTRTTNWLFLGLVSCIQMVSRYAIYIVVAHPVHKSFLLDSSAKVSWLAFSGLFVAAIGLVVNGFLLDYRWKNAQTILIVCLIVHALLNAGVGVLINVVANDDPSHAIITNPFTADSLWVPATLFVLAYLTCSYLQTVTAVAAYKNLAQWYHGATEQAVICALGNIFLCADVFFSYILGSALMSEFKSHVQTIYFLASGLLFVGAIAMTGVRFQLKPSDDSEFYIAGLQSKKLIQLETVSAINEQDSAFAKENKDNVLHTDNDNEKHDEHHDDKKKHGGHRHHDDDDTSDIKLEEVYHVVEWKNIFRTPDIYLYGLTFFSLGVMTEGNFVWKTGRMLSISLPENPAIAAASLVIICVSSIVSALQNLIFMPLATLAKPDMMPLYMSFCLGLAIFGTFAFLLTSSVALALVALVVLGVFRDAVFSIRRYVCVSTGGFLKTGRITGIILACHYIGSAVGAALGQISDSSDEGFRAWLVIIATFICLAFVFSCVLSGKRLLQCIYLRVKKDKETI